MSGKSATAGDRLQTAELERACFDARIRGLSYRAIAAECNTTEATAHRAVTRVLARTRAAANEHADELRAIELDRLDRLMVALGPQVKAGHLGAIDRILAIMARRAKLLGLDAPVKTDVTTGGESLIVRVVREDRGINGAETDGGRNIPILAKPAAVADDDSE